MTLRHAGVGTDNNHSQQRYKTTDRRHADIRGKLGFFNVELNGFNLEGKMSHSSERDSFN